MAGVDLRYEPHLALALGGGGALGAAHAGVLEVLHERGIQPSIVVGTSAGSIAGGAYANGRDPYELTELVIRASWGDFGTFSMTPGLGLLDTEGLRETVDRIGHDSMIEDMPIRFAAVATDLSTEEAVLIDHGSLVEAIGASIAVPGLFRPKELDGRTFVDGGVVQNLPIEAAFTMGASHVIGVRLAPEWDFLPKMRTALHVHEYEIRDDVTMITPRLRHRSQWVARDLPGLVQLGREAAELALKDYPVVNPRPVADAPDAAPTTPEVAQEAPEEPAPPRGVAAFFQRRSLPSPTPDLPQ
ncbi:patatin-like phospholipase family protein [Demequina sp.]|uniref:patatin-like phospholipase family protein n=1 Tax=Demequina sp. TaxID=2050685 RepID=UPI003D11F8B4